MRMEDDRLRVILLYGLFLRDGRDFSYCQRIASDSTNLY
jgi:hypothetical protein